MMDKKSFGAVVLSIFAFSAYSYYLQLKYPEYYAGQVEQTVAEDNNVSVAASEQSVKTEKVEVAVEKPVDSSIESLDEKELLFEMMIQ